MGKMVRVGIIGDFDPKSAYHRATNEALVHAADSLGVGVDTVWVATPSIEQGRAREVLTGFDALWCAPGSPYASMSGALRGIQFARAAGVPYLGT
jgi:CTP synthase (UTP-ammonia lyase)